MATLHVRNVPDELYAALRGTAVSRGESISGTVVALLAEALFPRRNRPAFSFRGRARRSQKLAPFERFTPLARAMMVTAQHEARELGHNYLGTEHLLLGLFGEGVAGRALAALELSPERVREHVITHVGRGDAATAGAMPLTPRSKRVLELALRDALARGQNHVGTEHVLVALSCEAEGVAAHILREAGADETALRVAVAEALRQGGTTELGGEEAFRVGAAEVGGEAAFRVAPTGLAVEDAFRVVDLAGSSPQWQEALNDAAEQGWELVSIHADAGGGRAVFRAA